MSSTTINHLNLASTRSPSRVPALLAQGLAQVLSFFTPAAPRRDPAAEAARVRAMANDYERFDPRFAADLYAAADRHELTHQA